MDLLRKYNVPGPRYTSYPTVPHWSGIQPSGKSWSVLIQERQYDSGEEGISLYIHLPFCEKMCTYCGCTTRITVNHEVESPYIELLLKEWEMYLEFLSPRTVIKELHLGGGTPTFFAPGQLKRLIEGISAGLPFADKAELSFEAHPANTTYEHLLTLYKLGFKRLSLGVQDFNPEVQQHIKRVQSREDVERVVQQARSIGYESINFDLIFGLPAQSLESIRDTMAQTISLRPDRLAYYSYAHVPWLKPAQRLYEDLLPDQALKFELYKLGRELLEEASYAEIGMDHFALVSDSLYQAVSLGKLHRNFMGYTVSDTPMLLGLGVSAISDTWTAFAQNDKSVESYSERIRKGEFAFIKGHELTKEELYIRNHILQLMCSFETQWLPSESDQFWDEVKIRLEPLEQDGLVEIGALSLKVTNVGKSFVRNIAMALDKHLWDTNRKTQLFSQTV